MISLLGLLIVVAYVVVSIAIIFIVGKKKSARAAGIVAGVLVLLGTWDVILGRAALWYSCEFKRESTHPVERIALPATFFDRHGYVNWNLLKTESRYALEYKSETTIDWLGLKETRAFIFDRAKNRKIAENTSFLVSPGWLEQFMSPLLDSCREDKATLDSVFAPSGPKL